MPCLASTNVTPKTRLTLPLHLRRHTARHLVPVPVRASSDPVIVREFENGSDSCESMVFIVDELAGCGLQLRGGDTVYAGEDLCVGHAAAIADHLSSDIVCCA